MEKSITLLLFFRTPYNVQYNRNSCKNNAY